jgi:ABC-2 type transport system ATP-binding protein
MGEATLEAHAVSKSYRGLTALEGLDWTVRGGEVVGLLGPNGAGKTTAIRVLTTVLKPTGGSFSVAGVPHTSPAQIRRRIGVLPESAGYPEEQTGREFLRYHARLFGQSRASAELVAGGLLGEVGLADRGRSRIATYSRGMKQRLGIARALVNDPLVVFLDEPTLGLDPAGQREVLRLVQRIARRRGASVVLSTHFLGEVEETCSRVLILNRGRVAADGTVAEITRRAAAPRRGRLRVPPELRERALATLAGAPGVVQARPAGEQPDWLTVTVNGTGGAAPEARGEFMAAIQTLIDAHIPLLAFELEGARLSDAFLSMTEAAC